MKFYFYSDLNACLKINGEYSGGVSKNVSATNLSEKGDFLFEFLPNNYEFLPCYGKAGSGKITAYEFLNGILIYPEYEKKRNRPYKVLDLKRFNFVSGDEYVKTYFDGGIMYDIDGVNYIRGELPFTPARVEAEDLGGFKAYVFTGEKPCVVVYSDASGNAVYKDVLSEFSFRGGTLTAIKRVTNATIPFVLYETYAIGEPFTLIKRETEFLKSPFMINENLVDYALLELILKKADISRFLSPDLRQKSNDLYSFLGGVKGAFSYCDDGKPKTAVIETDKISYITFEKSNSLITNISLTD